MALNATTPRLGISAYFANLNVFVKSNCVAVREDCRGGQRWRFTVPNYGTDIADLMARTTAHVALVTFPDFRVLYLYDPADDHFGYACNLDWPDGSEWGYAPFTSSRPGVVAEIVD
jgi:hypothetical protein